MGNALVRSLGLWPEIMTGQRPILPAHALSIPCSVGRDAAMSNALVRSLGLRPEIMTGRRPILPAHALSIPYSVRRDAAMSNALVWSLGLRPEIRKSRRKKTPDRNQAFHTSERCLLIQRRPLQPEPLSHPPTREWPSRRHHWNVRPVSGCGYTHPDAR